MMEIEADDKLFIEKKSNNNITYFFNKNKKGNNNYIFDYNSNYLPTYLYNSIIELGNKAKLSSLTTFGRSFDWAQIQIL